jgi:hypothetical protein
MTEIVIDNFLEFPEEYREAALKLDYKTFEFPECTFHGIALGGPSMQGVERIVKGFPVLQPTMTFFRKSPKGQVEPHYIHSDIDMGQWSAILYLNPEPPVNDGTAFWTHIASGAIESHIPHERSDEGREPEKYFCQRKLVEARFNRLLLFPSSFFHSRSIHENWGEGDQARLTQVTFGRFRQ